MSIITISRGSYSRGKEVAEKLSAKLNYECLSRDVVLEACKEFNIPEIKLVRALHDSPTVLERFRHGKERYLSFFNYALLKHLQNDNIVYHGLAGHYFLQNIPHVFKVRIIADMEDRVKEEMKRENISHQEALFILKKDDEERRKWGVHIHGVDPWDSRLYDMVLHINALTVDDVVQILYETIKKPNFATTDESKAIIDNLTRNAKVQSILVNFSPKVRTVIKDRKVYISHAVDSLKTDKDVRKRIEEAIKDLDGIDEVIFNEPLIPKRDYINPYHNL